MDKIEVQRMRSSGSTYQEIATKMGVSRQRIHQIITGYKAPTKLYEEKSLSRENSKTVVLTYYGGGKLACVKCGFADMRALSLDHIKGDGYKDRHVGGGSNLYAWLIRRDFPLGYQTLCMNCQWIKRVENNEIRRPK